MEVVPGTADPTPRQADRSTPAGPPPVTVVVAVYNALPDLHDCLRSLTAQTIGPSRMQLVLVDDGSTDGSGAVLDRFAAVHPGPVTVLHQANSGGPAQPNNRALDLATGRYVFFLGADDRLGPEALDRLVAAADTTGADIVLGRMVGVNGRYAHQAIFDGNHDDVDPFDSPLAYHLSNTKLFRRELIETHRIRYPEMPVGSDQPFTIEACLRARRIAVRSDYAYYFAVRRRRSSNMTYTSGHEAKLAYTNEVIAHVARLIEPGPHRDAILTRHFDWELAKLLDDRFARLDRRVQEAVRRGVAELVESYLTDRIRARLTAETVVRLMVARHGTVDDLLAVIRQDAEIGTPATILDGTNVWAGYPGFRAGLPDACFDITGHVEEWRSRLHVVSGRMDLLGRTVTLGARSPRHDYVAADLHAGSVPGRVVGQRADQAGSLVEVAFDVGALIRQDARKLWVGDTAVRALWPAAGQRRLWLSLRHRAVVIIGRHDNGQARLSAHRITLGRVWRRLRHGL